jgi:hypothetical protein
MIQMKSYGIGLFLVVSCTMNAINEFDLFKVLDVKKIQPFGYDLGIEVVANKNPNAGVTICCHGYGSSSHIAEIVDSFNVVPDHIVAFNFPDYDLMHRPYDPRKSTFGSIQELLPFLYIIKRCVCDAGLTVINLYGFSAGGAAVVNTLVVLNEATYDAELAQIGISADDKKRMIAAIKQGLVVLDCPLKSIEEVVNVRGQSREFMILGDRYRANNMRPIDSVQYLKGLPLNILLHFQQPDEVIGNREDQLFIDRLCAANSGKTQVVIGHEGGHNAYHASLWSAYAKLRCDTSRRNI